MIKTTKTHALGAARTTLPPPSLFSSCDNKTAVQFSALTMHSIGLFEGMRWGFDTVKQRVLGYCSSYSQYLLSPKHSSRLLGNLSEPGRRGFKTSVLSSLVLYELLDSWYCVHHLRRLCASILEGRSSNNNQRELLGVIMRCILPTSCTLGQNRQS